MFATIDETLNGSWSEEMHTYVRKAVVELYAIFSAQGWTWSGDRVTEDMLAGKVISLAMDVARTLKNDPERGWCAISSGRVQVEARLSGEHLAFYVNLHTSVGF